MEYAQDFHPPPAYPIGNEVTGPGHRKFPGAVDPARAPEPGLARQQFNCMYDAHDDLLCGQRVVLGNVGGFFIEVAQCFAQPHDFQRLYAAFCHLRRIFLTSDGLAKSPASASCRAA